MKFHLSTEKLVQVNDDGHNFRINSSEQELITRKRYANVKLRFPKPYAIKEFWSYNFTKWDQLHITIFSTYQMNEQSLMYLQCLYVKIENVRKTDICINKDKIFVQAMGFSKYQRYVFSETYIDIVMYVLIEVFHSLLLYKIVLNNNRTWIANVWWAWRLPVKGTFR